MWKLEMLVGILAKLLEIVIDKRQIGFDQVVTTLVRSLTNIRLA